MADSKKHPNGELSLQEAADLLDVHYILAGPLRDRGFSVGDLGADIDRRILRRDRREQSTDDRRGRRLVRRRRRCTPPPQPAPSPGSTA